MLASKINLLTHYAKGTLLFLILIFTRAAYKITTSKFYLTVLFTIAYILYLALEEGSPIFKQILSILLKLGYYYLVFT